MRKTLLLLLLALPLGALAQEETSQPREIGADTRAWTELQKSNTASLAVSRPLPGEVANKVYERYLKSYEHPIPEHFDRESLGTGGSSK